MHNYSQLYLFTHSLMLSFDVYLLSILYNHSYILFFDRLPFIAGNWKMNTDLKSAIQLANDVVELTKDVLTLSLMNTNNSA